MKDPFLLTLLLALPVVAMIRSFFRKESTIVSGENPDIARELASFWPMILFPILSLGLAYRLHAPLTFGVLALLPVALFSPEPGNQPRAQGQPATALLIWFFATGFLISPDPLWATVFLEGLLGSLLLSGTFGPLSGDVRAPRLLELPAPILWSAILFPVSQWLAGAFPGEHMAPSSLAFFLGIFSLGLLIPAMPFMKWLYLYPPKPHIPRILLIRLVTALVAADGLCRFVLPELSGWNQAGLSGSFTGQLGMTVILVSALLTAIQGLALAATEPVISLKIAHMAFTGATMITPSILIGGDHRTAILILLAATLILPTLGLIIPMAHIEQETRRRMASSLGGLLTNMPRAGLIMALGALALSGFPGFTLASALCLFPFSPGTWLILLLFLAIITAMGILLGQTLGNLFLGEEPKSTIRPQDLSNRQLLYGITLLIPLVLLAFLPPATGERTPQSDSPSASLQEGAGSWLK